MNHTSNGHVLSFPGVQVGVVEVAGGQGEEEVSIQDTRTCSLRTACITLQVARVWHAAVPGMQHSSSHMECVLSATHRQHTTDGVLMLTCPQCQHTSAASCKSVSSAMSHAVHCGNSGRARASQPSTQMVVLYMSLQVAAVDLFRLSLHITVTLLHKSMQCNSASAVQLSWVISVVI
jgi:hypothetical protein